MWSRLPRPRCPELGRPALPSPADEKLRLPERRERLADSRSVEQPARAMAAPAYLAHRRSQQLEQVAQEADRHSRRGFELAGRGATSPLGLNSSARWRSCAQGLDAEFHTTLHSRAFSASATALQEADDFLPRNLRAETELTRPTPFAPTALPCSRAPIWRRLRRSMH